MLRNDYLHYCRNNKVSFLALNKYSYHLLSVLLMQRKIIDRTFKVHLKVLYPNIVFICELINLMRKLWKEV